MAIELQEYIGSSAINKEISKSSDLQCQEYQVDLDPIADNSIMQEIEGLHVGPTRNFTWYMESALDSSIPSWTKPYQKPLIMHHNEQNGKIIGRVCHAEKKTKNTRSGTPALLFTCNVPDKEGIEQIKDGRLKTVSVGVTAHDVRCSICGRQIELDENGNTACGHDRGAEYKNSNGEYKTCYWEVYEMEAKELSYVIVPSDIYAHNVRTYKPTKIQQKGLSESLESNQQEINLSEGEFKKMDIEKTNQTDLKEKQNIEEEVKKDTSAEATATEAETKETTEISIVEQKDKEISDLKAEVERLKAEKTVVAKDLAKSKDDLSVIVDRLDSVEKALKQEVVLKEAAETNLIAAKTELREAVEENLNTLRSALNKPVVLKESLAARTIESIKDSIGDLKSEMSGFTSVKEITEAEDPTLKTQEIVKKADIDVKEAKIDSNIDVKESARQLLSDLLL
jgi:hypothetical protein